MTTAKYQRDPDTFFVFISGINSEWEIGREEFGDVALFRAYLRAGVPRDQVVFAKDADATRDSCQAQLDALLDKTTPGSTLVFYYGGHGLPTGFCTNEGNWAYRDVLRSVHERFAGDAAILLADCCASGNLAKSLPKPEERKHSYLLLMSAMPYCEAGPAWTMTTAWLKCMQCAETGTMVPLSQAVEYLADETVKEKAEILTALCSSEDPQFLEKSAFPVSGANGPRMELKWTKPISSIDPDALISSGKVSRGDAVFYFHKTSKSPDSSFPLSLWFPAMVVSSFCGLVRLQVTDPITNQTWNATDNVKNMISPRYMASFFVMSSDSFRTAQHFLAQRHRYLDISAIEAGTVVTGLWWDDKEYRGTIIDWRDVFWDDFVKFLACDEKPGPPGPYVAISWKDEDTYSIFPLERTKRLKKDERVKDGNYLRGAEEAIRQPVELSEREALVRSLYTFGKTLCNAHDELGTKKLRCVWPSDCIDWYDAVSLDHNDLDWRMLTLHAQFTPKGPYCFVRFDEDDSISLVPLAYIEPRESKNDGCCTMC